MYLQEIKKSNEIEGEENKNVYKRNVELTLYSLSYEASYFHEYGNIDIC
jgi:hypothetical protein